MVKRLFLVALLMFIALAVCGCDDKDAQIADLNNQIAELKKQNIELKNQIGTLSQELSTLNSQKEAWDKATQQRIKIDRDPPIRHRF